MSYASSSNWSSAEYITNSQNAWMNWSTAPPPPSLSQLAPDPAYNSSTSNVSYGYAPEYTRTSANNDPGLSMYENPGEKKFDTAFAAPAINLGTGDRFSQLLEAKMSLMNAGSGLAQPNGGGIEVQQQSYDYGMQNYPFQPQPQPQPQSQTNPYPLPVSASTSSTYDPTASTNGYLTPNRFSNMIMSGVPAPANTSNTFMPDMAVNPPPLQTPQAQNQNQIPPQFMPDSDTYQIAPPPPPQGDLSDSTTSSSASPRSILSSFLSQRSNININVNQQSYQGTPVYSQQVTPSFDRREVEKHLADWSQVHIQPDLVAPLPASVQDYKRQATPPVVLGDGSRYKNLSSSNTSMEYPQQYPFTYPPSQSTSAQNSFNPSPSVNHLPVSGQTSIRSSHSPTVLSHSIDQTQPQQRPSITGWTSSQPITPIIASSSSQPTLPPVPPQDQEALPPLLKIRMKDSASGGSALPPPPDNLELEPILEWTSTQPALIPKKQSRPKDVSGNIQKGKKFSFSTSVSRADMGIKGHSHKRRVEDEVEVVQREETITKDRGLEQDRGTEKETKKGRPEKRKRKSTNLVEKEDEAGEPKSIKPTKAAKPPIEKTIIACNNCRAKKLKCNGEKPKCFHCHRRGEETCLYEAVLRRRGPGKHNKEKKSKSGSGGTGTSKKRKSTRGGDQDGESDSESESDPDPNTEDDEGDTPIETKKSKSRSKRQSKSSSAIPLPAENAVESERQSQGEDRHHYFESFGLGGGGSIGRIDTRRLDESELKNMSYVLNSNSNSDHNRDEDGRERDTQGGSGNLAMGFGGGLNIIDSGPLPHLGGIGSRFVTSTARE